MIDFWEHYFEEKQTARGFEPAESAIIVIKMKSNQLG